MGMSIPMKLARIAPRHPFKVLAVVYLAIFSSWIGFQLNRGKTFESLLFSQEQRAQLDFNEGNYLEAGKRFSDPLRSGLSFYLAEDFTTAAKKFQSIESDEALFNLANSFAHGYNFLYSLATYNVLLERSPEYPGALKNRAIVQGVVDEMKALGESQQPEGGTSQEEMDHPMNMEFDKEQIEFGEQEAPEQLTADQLLNDPELADLWMKQVQSDPAEFLSNKFHLQLQNEEAAQPSATTQP